MRSLLYAFILAILFISACKSDEGKVFKLTNSDEEYTLVTAGEGELPTAGDFSVFSLLIKGDDGRVLLDRSEEANYGKFQIPADSSKFRQGSPIDELMTLLVEGDSAVLVYVLDTLEKTNPAVAGLNSISYEISVKEIITEEEMNEQTVKEQKKREAARSVAQEKEPLVAARLAEALESYKNGSLGDALQTTDSGMEYLVETQGDGITPVTGDMVEVHYYGILESNGDMFDNSYQRGDFFSFPVGQGRVIQGWDEALQVMPRGTEAIFFIPYELAYGAAGRPPRIPEKAMLVFYIEYPK